MESEQQQGSEATIQKLTMEESLFLSKLIFTNECQALVNSITDNTLAVNYYYYQEGNGVRAYCEIGIFSNNKWILNTNWKLSPEKGVMSNLHKSPFVKFDQVQIPDFFQYKK